MSQTESRYLSYRSLASHLAQPKSFTTDSSWDCQHCLSRCRPSSPGALKGRPPAAAAQLVPAAGKAFDSSSSRKDVVPVDLCPSDEHSAAREALKQRKRRNEAERKKKDDKKKGGKEQIVRPRLPLEVRRGLVERDQQYDELEQKVLSWRAKGPKLLKLQSHNKTLTQSVATLEKQLSQCNK